MCAGVDMTARSPAALPPALLQVPWELRNSLLVLLARAATVATQAVLREVPRRGGPSDRRRRRPGRAVHPLQQRPVECFSSLLIHDSRSSARRRVSCREVPSQLTGAPQSIDWREAAGAQGLCRRGRNGAPPKVRRGAAVRCAARGVPHPRQSRLDCVWGGIRVGYVCHVPQRLSPASN